MYCHPNVLLSFLNGELSEEFLLLLDEEDFIIGADRGALFLISHGYTPDIAVGDFDSVSPEALQQIEAGSKKTITCDPVDKDLTDSEMALELALNTQPESILLIGVTGDTDGPYTGRDPDDDKSTTAPGKLLCDGYS